MPATGGHRSLGWRGGLLVLAVAAFVLVPGTGQTRFFDRDEGWYAQVCREMRETGDWLVPRYLGEVWLGKPPALYWLVLASFRALGEGEWQARLVSVVFMSISAVLVGILGSRLFGRRTGVLSGVTFITCGLPIVVGKLLLADALMLACTLTAVLAHFALADRGVTHRRAAVYWLAVGLGVMVKGPATLLFAGGFALALLCSARWRGWLADWRWWLWLLLGLLVAGPWYVFMSVHARDALFGQFLWQQSFARIMGGSHPQSSPPGLCLLVSLAGLLPWTPLVPRTLVLAFKGRKSDPALRLLLIWLVVPWVIVELMRAKLPHYVLPCYVPLAILLARQMVISFSTDRPLRMRSVHERAAWAFMWGIMVVIGLACAGLGLLAHQAPWGWPLATIGTVLVIGFLASAWLLLHRSMIAGWWTAVAGVVAFHLVAGFWLLPSREPQRLSPQVARAINELAQPGDQIYLCGYNEPTVHYYLAGRARDVHRRELESVLANSTGPVLLAITQRSMDRLDDGLRNALMPSVREQSISGLNEANMRPETIHFGRLSSDALANRHSLR